MFSWSTGLSLKFRFRVLAFPATLPVDAFPRFGQPKGNIPTEGPARPTRGLRQGPVGHSHVGNLSSLF